MQGLGLGGCGLGVRWWFRGGQTLGDGDARHHAWTGEVQRGIEADGGEAGGVWVRVMGGCDGEEMSGRF